MSWIEDVKNRIKERLGICKNCPHFIPSSQRCSICGCFMTVKASISVAKCPKGYW